MIILAGETVISDLWIKAETLIKSMIDFLFYNDYEFEYFDHIEDKKELVEEFFSSWASWKASLHGTEFKKDIESIQKYLESTREYFTQ